MPGEIKTYQKICNFCGESFIAKKRTTQCCGDPCAKRAYKLKKRQNNDNKFEDTQVKKEAALKTNILLEEILNAVRQTNRHLAVSGKPYLTPDEVCTLLSFSRKSFTRLVQKTQLAIYRFGKKQYIKRDDLDKLFFKPQIKES